MISHPKVQPRAILYYPADKKRAPVTRKGKKMNKVIQDILNQASNRKVDPINEDLVAKASHQEITEAEHTSSSLSERELLLATMDDGSGSLFPPRNRA